MASFVKYTALAMTATVLLLSISTTSTDAIALYAPFFPPAEVLLVNKQFNDVRESLKLPLLKWSQELSLSSDTAVKAACASSTPTQLGKDQVIHDFYYPESDFDRWFPASKLQSEFKQALVDWKKEQDQPLALLSDANYKSVGCAMQRCPVANALFDVKIVCQYA